MDGIKSAVTKVAAAKGASLAVLFGSFARRDNSRRSDIDLMFIEDTDDKFIDRIGHYQDLLFEREELRPLDIDVLVYTEEEIERMKEFNNHFIIDILKDGLVIYEQPKE